MATPDLSTFTRSSEIFTSPRITLPQIRAIHKALHAEIEDKASRLRTQVGASYRDLLGTADTIVAMRSDMESVQASLGHLGSRCGRDIVGAKVSSLASFIRATEEEDEDEDEDKAAGDAVKGCRPRRVLCDRATRLGLTARARLLDACALTADRALKDNAVLNFRADSEPAGKGVEGRSGEFGSRGDRLVVAAKILVLSRLLANSLRADIEDRAVASTVEAAKKALGALKRRLLRKIDRLLQAVGGRNADREDVLKALSAYGLATSSGARDILRHFLRMRGEAMALIFSADERERAHGAKDVLRCLNCYAQTLLDVQALVPTRLTEALRALKKEALLADKSLRGMEELRLDVYRRWLPDEVLYYTPFLRHDDLDGPLARETLASWAREAGDVFLDGLEQTLAGLSEFRLIVDTRTSLLKLWITEGGKARGFDATMLLRRIREVVNRHMLRLLDAKISKLHIVGSETEATLAGWKEGVTDQQRGLWDPDSFDMDLSSGAVRFTHDVVDRLYGRNDAVSKAVSSYRSWLRVIDEARGVVEQLRRQRWDNDVEDIEDEETIAQRQQLLSRDDPQSLLDHLGSSLVAAFRELDRQLASQWASCSESPNRGARAAYLLRVIRDIRGQLPDAADVKEFGQTMVPGLQQAVAAAVAVSPIDEFALAALTRKQVAGRSLWEGEPDLPTTPSPGLFTFVRNVSVAMTDAGMDLWGPAALAVLKQHLRQQVSQVWLEALAAGDAGKKSPEASAEAGEGGVEGDLEEAQAADDTQSRDLLLQWLYDVSYLRRCLASPSKTTGEGAAEDGDELKDLQDKIQERAGLDAAARQRLAKSAQEYWKRTSLLFGLLA